MLFNSSSIVNGCQCIVCKAWRNSVVTDKEITLPDVCACCKPDTRGRQNCTNIININVDGQRPPQYLSTYGMDILNFGSQTDYFPMLQGQKYII